MENKNNHNIIGKPLEEIMSEGFGRYAKYIIQDRALPDIRDGLKPVQRRIIYSMNNLQLFYDRPHKKSARVVGDVIGKYHPHGDSSIYEALVRMSQDWKNNITLVDMHGNNGSIDGDGPAAMRYTECRLSQFGQLMTTDINKNTVEFINNFDNSEQEPTVLPTLLPNLLVNGSNGIAAGYATNIPPFNFNEVIDSIITRIDSPNCFVSSILKVMPGPDFPTGGIIMNTEGIKQAYETGKGKIVIRSKIVKQDARRALITNIPYETNKSQIIRNISELVEKYDALAISEVLDESDKNGVCISLALKQGANLDFIKNFLYKNTQLQISYSLNMVAIKDAKPYQMSILFILDAFINHADHVILSSCTFDLNKAKERKEIIEGLIKAIRILDDVISLIRHSSNKETAKQSLMTSLLFSEKQAEAIVNLRLYRLSNADITDLNNELNELNIKINELSLLVNDKQVRSNFLKNKLRSFKKIFNCPRKTEISNEDANITIEQVDTIKDQEQVIVITRDGYVKNIPKKSYAASELEQLKLKENDLPIAKFISNQRDKVVLITSLGNYISIPTYKIDITKWKEMGIHVNNIITTNPNEKIVYAFNYKNNVEDNRCLTLASKNGVIKRVLVKSLGISKLTKISTCMNLDENDTLVSCVLFDNGNDNTDIGIITHYGIGLVYPSNQISVVSKNAAGVKAISLKDNDKLVAIFDATNLEDFVLIAANQGMKRIKVSCFQKGSRANVGRHVVSYIKSNPISVIDGYTVNNNTIINAIDTDKKWNVFTPSEIPIGDENTKVSFIKNKRFLGVSILIKEEKKQENLMEKVEDSSTNNPVENQQNSIFDYDKEK